VYNNSDHTYQLGAKIAWLYGAFIGFIGMIASGAMIVVLWYGATLVLKHEMSRMLCVPYLLLLSFRPSNV
jgi:ABC-type bacteriocin/lantibiotic exporter with double-glycine peptidase domain